MGEEGLVKLIESLGKKVVEAINRRVGPILRLKNKRSQNGSERENSGEVEEKQWLKYEFQS